MKVIVFRPFHGDFKDHKSNMLKYRSDTVALRADEDADVARHRVRLGMNNVAGLVATVLFHFADRRFVIVLPSRTVIGRGVNTIGSEQGFIASERSVVPVDLEFEGLVDFVGQAVVNGLGLEVLEVPLAYVALYGEVEAVIDPGAMASRTPTPSTAFAASRPLASEASDLAWDLAFLAIVAVLHAHDQFSVFELHCKSSFENMGDLNY